MHSGSGFFFVPGEHLFPFVKSHNGLAVHCCAQFEGNAYTLTCIQTYKGRSQTQSFNKGLTLFCKTCFFACFGNQPACSETECLCM